MLGTPKHDEALTLGEEITAWRMGLRNQGNAMSELETELGSRAFGYWQAGTSEHVVAFALELPRRAQSGAWDHSKTG